MPNDVVLGLMCFQLCFRDDAHFARGALVQHMHVNLVLLKLMFFFKLLLAKTTLEQFTCSTLNMVKILFAILCNLVAQTHNLATLFARMRAMMIHKLFLGFAYKAAYFAYFQAELPDFRTVDEMLF